MPRWSTSRAVPTVVPFVLFASVAGSGCAYGELQQVLRSEVASELDCPSVSIEPRNPAHLKGAREGDDQWKLRGCGVVRTYTCPPDDGLTSYGDTGCTFVEGDADAPELAKDEGEDLLDEQPLDEQPLDEQPLDEQPLDEQPLDEQPLDDDHDSSLDDDAL